MNKIDNCRDYPIVNREKNGPKILVGYPYFPSLAYKNVEKWTLEYLQRLRNAGFDVEGFCLTLNPPAPRLTWKELDRRWKQGNRALLAIYDNLEKKLQGKDVLINDAGINLHPEFVRNLKGVVTVYQCFDDPESSEDLSKPVASSYDMCLIGNIASIEMYKKWGCENAFWSPQGINNDIYDPSLTYEDILNEERDIDLFMMIDRNSPFRKVRVNLLEKAFPEGQFYGQGWPKGYLKWQNQISYLRRTKIGPNLHNSTGPTSSRTFYLPANGVLQICDNKSFLGKIYKLNKEVIGFDTIEECIDLCKYYLCHDEERRKIAAEGWKRAVNDYNEISVFSRKVAYIEKLLVNKTLNSYYSKIAIQQRKRLGIKIVLFECVNIIIVVVKKTMPTFIKTFLKKFRKNNIYPRGKR